VRIARSHLGWGWTGLGLAGSLASTVAGADLLAHKPIEWWLHPRVPGRELVFYAGIAAVCAAWLGLGRRLGRAPGTAPRELLLIGALWALPLMVGPSLFSRDLYSYLADGSILHLGLSPYHQAPAVLAAHDQSYVLNAVSSFWRHTTAPYGPSFLGLASPIAAAAGSNLILGVLLLRAVELGGVVLLAIFVPRLARALGTDPARATWLAVISPLVLLELIAAGHNDALMAGLLVAGVTLAVERRPLAGIVICALAATVKLPAAAGIVFIALSWWRAEPDQAAKIATLSTTAVLAVFVAVGAVTGLGLGWISGGLLSTPGKVRLAITPATAIGYSGASLLHALGVSVASRSLESAVGAVALALTGVLGLVLCRRVRYENLVWYLGLLLLASVLGGPAAWPWYLSWGLALVAACAGPQRWRWLPPVIAATAFLVRVDGQLVLPRQTAPFVLAVYIAAAIIAGWGRRRRRPDRPAVQRVSGRASGEPAALTSS
jgi:hypothetical protein